MFIKEGLNKNGNTVALANRFLKDKDYETLHLVDYKIYSYGQEFADDQWDEVVNKMKEVKTIVIGSPGYWHNISESVRNVLDRFYGYIDEGEWSGRDFYFVFQGAAPEKWMLEASDYTMKRFAYIYGMNDKGMITKEKEISNEEKTIRSNKYVC